MTAVEDGVEVQFRLTVVSHMPLDRMLMAYELGVVGSIAALGDWDWKRALRLELCSVEQHTWAAELRLPHTDTIEYKYVLVAPDGSRCLWEQAGNRALHLVEPTLAFVRADDRALF
ncbi:hypothetical protein CDCA_CDCA04G1375 [Cyanidium caldarium]|uniref:CBM20 domain-containing protein n=1 Tax=Cyanidium caldarium TaxID=2771 RepID=A0AAV9ITB7_CYACA|nr:hypothetical protein CDCA_CDCA04G1375 [Cyanidium caldarium]